MTAASLDRDAGEAPNRSARLTNGLAAAAPAVGILLLQLIFFPLPLGLFLRGLIIGGLSALVALGMALIYRANRIINFAQADLGTAPVVLMLMLMTAWGWPYLLSLGAALVGAVVVGAVVELAIIRRFFRTPRLLLTVATLGLAQLLAAGAILLPRAFGSQRLFSNRLDQAFGGSVAIGGTIFHANDLIAAIVIPVAIAALALFLRATSAGVAIRASADSADRAALLGVPVKRLQTVVWVVASLLAFVALFLRAGLIGLPVTSALTLGVLLTSLAALVLGRMTDMVAITLSALALGTLQAGVTFNSSNPLLLDPILGVIIVVALLAGRRPRGRTDLADASSWQSAEEVRPLAPALARLPEVRITRALVGGILLAAVVVLPHLLSVDRSLKASAVLIYAVLGLSVVVLTGWAGQVSLGQVGFFAIGAAVGGKATQAWHVDILVAFLLAAVVGAVAAVVVGFPALRLRGFYLAVTTLAFALALTSWALNRDYFKWVPRQADRIPRPPLLGRIDIDSPTRIYYLALAVLLVCLVALRGIRFSRTGRALIALRDNERGAQAYGINAIRVRLSAFAVSGAVAALAGALFVHHQQAIDVQPYEPGQNLLVFTMVIVGGVTTSAGAVLGALYLQGVRWFLPSDWQFLASALGVLLVLLILPGGIGSLLYRLRDRWLLWVADRHQVDAPGLRPEAEAAPGATDEPDVLVGAMP